MSRPFLLFEQQWHTSVLDVVSQETSRAVAEAKALFAYNDRSLHMVAVVEIDDYALPEDRYNTVFKLERLCKCSGLQRVFDFKGATSQLECPLCRLRFGKATTINEALQPQEGVPNGIEA